MELRTTQRRVAGFHVLALDGVADLAALPRLHDAIQALLAHGATAMAIDLDGVAVLDDAALGLLLGAAAAARQRGGELRVVCCDGRLRARLAETRLDLAVVVVDSLTDRSSDRSDDAS